jgi:hypothetical protein
VGGTRERDSPARHTSDRSPTQWDARRRDRRGTEAPRRRRIDTLVGLVGRHRYLPLSSCLVAMMTSQTLNQQWSTDFWEHSVVIRELATHLLHPRHPLLLVDVPHPYSSPHTLAVAALARLLGVGPIGAPGHGHRQPRAVPDRVPAVRRTAGPRYARPVLHAGVRAGALGLGALALKQLPQPQLAREVAADKPPVGLAHLLQHQSDTRNRSIYSKANEHGHDTR